ncbi:MAG: ABC transporter substrate-binding protein [Spirochaetia bacterium]
MKKRSLLVVLVLVFASVAFVFAAGSSEKGTAAKNTKGPWTIGYDIYYLGNSWSVQLAEEFKAAAELHKDQIKNLILTESGGSADKEIANIEDMIAQKVDAVILSPASPGALAPVCEKAMKAGIVVVLCASKINTGAYTSLVTVDDTEFGKVGAEWLAKKLNGKGKIVALNGIPGYSTNEERFAGAKSVFAKYPGIQIVGAASADWDYAKAKTVMSDLLQANPVIDGVWSQGGAMTLGAIEAFQAANRPLVPMTGEDNNGLLKVWAKLKPQGFETVALSKPTWLSARSLEVALDALAGKTVKKDEVIPPPQVTNDTLDKFVRPDLPDSFWTQTRLSDAQIQKLFSK